MTLDNFTVYWFQHACKGSLDIVGQLIDDIVVTDFDVFLLRQALCGSISFDIEADNDSIGSSCQVYISFADIADTLVNQANLDVLFAYFTKGILDSFCRTLYVTFEYNVQLLDFSLFHLH